MKHTPTPWTIDTSTGVITIKATIGFDEQLEAPISETIALLPMTETNEANAKRIVECVNACEGIHDPKELILAADVAMAENRELKKQRNELLVTIQHVLDNLGNLGEARTAHWFKERYPVTENLSLKAEPYEKVLSVINSIKARL